MKLYICLTYYHSLITLVKSLVDKEKYDILLANDIPGYSELKKSLEKTERFNRIIEYDANRIRNRKKYSKKNPLYYINDKRTICKKVERYCRVDFHKYSDIYLYHDLAEIGKYFVMKHIPYHLLEDALDYFKYFDDYYRVKSGSYKEGSLKFFIKKMTGIGYKLWGTADECIDIEVNDINGIKISSEKCIEIPRKVLFSKLTDKDRLLIFNTYSHGETMSETKEKSVIIFTQPLWKDHFVNSVENQLRVFDSITKEYNDLGYRIVIKPHPRDEADYRSIINKYNCDYIDKNMPSEILNFNPNAKYDVAVSITSTAINFLQYAKEKRFLGREYINEVLGNEA